MTEHEKLKEICDVIGYVLNEDLYFYDDIKKYYRDCYGDCRYIDVREIIFTTEFMDTLNTFLYKNYGDQGIEDGTILDNLNDPVDYIYKLLEIGK